MSLLTKIMDNSLVAISLDHPILFASSGLILTFTIYLIYLRYISALAGIPGPLFVMWSRIWLAYHSAKGDMHRVIPQLHEKYGMLVRVAPNEVSVADLNAIREIYGQCRLSFWCIF